MSTSTIHMNFFTGMAHAKQEDADLADYTSLEGRTRLSKMLMKLFDHWSLSIAEQAALLGLHSESRTSMKGYRAGKPLANSQDLLERAGHLLAIHKSLRILFPYDRDLAYSWVRSPNRTFHGKSPLEVMIEYRFAGLLKVRAYLEHARGR